MNTRFFLTLFVALALLTACVPSSTIPLEEDTPTEDTQTQEIFELGEFGLVAVPVGALQAGKTYYFIPGASGGISVTSVAKNIAVGVLVGVLVDRLVLSPGLVQDITEGPRTFYWDGQLTTINRANGQIQIIQLEDTTEAENASAAENAAEGEQANAREEEKMNQQNQPRRIAIVDDHKYYPKNLAEFITGQILGAQISMFPICDSLLSTMDSGTRFDAYIIDYDPGESGGLWGDVCTEEILSRHPGAVVIGVSQDDVGDEFTRSGARGFQNKKEGGDVIANYIKNQIP